MNTAAVSSSVLGSDQPVLDQIIDLSSEPSSMDPKTAMMVTKNNHTLSSADHNNVQGVLDVNDSVIGAPIIAFEDSITASTKSDVPTTAGIIAQGKIYMIIDKLFICYIVSLIYLSSLTMSFIYFRPSLVICDLDLINATIQWTTDSDWN